MPFARAMSDANRNERNEWLKISLGSEERAVSVASRAIVLSGRRIPAMSVDVAAAHWARVSALVASNAPTNDDLVIHRDSRCTGASIPRLSGTALPPYGDTRRRWPLPGAQTCHRAGHFGVMRR